jgi:hypothetical protein
MFAFESECWRKCIKLEVRRASFTTMLRTKHEAAYKQNFAGSRSALLVRDLTRSCLGIKPAAKATSFYPYLSGKVDKLM